MTFETYIKNLQIFARENPDSLKLEVAYSGDDEGNYYGHVYYTPTLGHLDSNNDFYDPDSFDDYELEEKDINIVIIN